MGARRFAVTVPAETGSLKSLRAFFASVLEAGGCAEAEQVVLAVDEACSNIIRYRCKTIEDGQIRVALELDPSGARFRIGRFCAAQDAGKIKPRNLAEVRPGGLGTAFISKIMDRVVLEEEPGQPGCLALLLEKRSRGGT